MYTRTYTHLYLRLLGVGTSGQYLWIPPKAAAQEKKPSEYGVLAWLSENVGRSFASRSRSTKDLRDSRPGP